MSKAMFAPATRAGAEKFKNVRNRSATIIHCSQAKKELKWRKYLLRPINRRTCEKRQKMRKLCATDTGRVEKNLKTHREKRLFQIFYPLQVSPILRK